MTLIFFISCPNVDKAKFIGYIPISYKAPPDNSLLNNLDLLVSIYPKFASNIFGIPIIPLFKNSSILYLDGIYLVHIASANKRLFFLEILINSFASL